jgi:hypothetical protein
MHGPRGPRLCSHSATAGTGRRRGLTPSDDPEGWVAMVSRVGPKTRALAGTNLRDFEIQAAAELGQCAGAQSFRAVRRRDKAPVLLHKFRPVDSLLELGPMLESEDPPDFTKPFVTRFTDLFTAAGSAYLVEPLPVCFSLADAWHYLLLNRPHQARAVTAILTRHLLGLLRQPARNERGLVALSVGNILLTPVGGFGVLVGGVRCREGLLWLRKDPHEPDACDRHSLAEVLRCLLDMEEELAHLRNVPMLLPSDVREGIRYLARAVEQSAGRVRG